jgi:hypothetical protein
MPSIAFPGKDSTGAQVANPFGEQLQFFRQKLNLPTARYDDILTAAHDRAFVVAGAATADLLADLRAAVADGIESGTGLQAFRENFKNLVLKHGWTGWTGEGSEAGHAWRTRVIYTTNMSTSYAAGRWKQLNDPDMVALRPYWKYVHADHVMHPRPLHLAWNGVVLRHDAAFWQTHFPPNGWGCQCRVVAVGAKDYEKALAANRATAPVGWDAIDGKTGAPVGIDKGWDYAPGANVDRPLQQLVAEKLIKLQAPIGAAMYEVLRPVILAERNAAFLEFLGAMLADPVKRNRTIVVGAIDPPTIRWLAANANVEPAGAEIALQDGLVIGRKAARHEAAGDAFTAAEWAQLPRLLDEPEQILYDTRTGKLLYIVPSADERMGKLAVEFEFKTKREGTLNMIVSGFKVPWVAIEADLKGGFLLIVR